SPCSFLAFASHTSAKASEPMPLLVGSSTGMQMAVATAASIAFPPCRSMCSPACTARGCDVATMFRASTGMRCDGYGNDHSKSVMAILYRESHETGQKHSGPSHKAKACCFDSRFGSRDHCPFGL